MEPYLNPSEKPSLAASILKGFTLDDIQDIAEDNPNLRGYLQGYLAERVLKAQIEELDGVSYIEKIPDESKVKGDFLILYRGQEFTLEAKSLATNSVKAEPESGWSARVRAKNVCKRDLEVPGLGLVRTSNLIKGDFDILGICCFAATGSWDFMYMHSSHLPEHSRYPGLIKGSFLVKPGITPNMTSSLADLLEETRKTKILEHRTFHVPT